MRYVVGLVAFLVMLAGCMPEFTPDSATPAGAPAPTVTPQVPDPSDTTEIPETEPTENTTPTPAPTPSITPSPTDDPSTTKNRQGTALAALAALPVKGRAPMTGYARERYGQTWLDADRNGCDTRNDVLAEHPTRVTHNITDSGAPGKRKKPAPKGPKTLMGSGQPAYFENCTAAGNAGAAPVRRGDPGYGLHLDRDGDGVGCE